MVVQAQNKVLDAGLDIVKEIPGLLKEFIRAGISNPVMGVAGAIIVSDILKRTGVISLEGQTAVLVAVGALTAGNVITDIGSLLPFHQNASSTEPSASTVVFGDGGTKELAGLIESLKGGK
jgi:hypothetical protein